MGNEDRSGNTYDADLTDSKKNCGPLLCTFFCGGIISYFFAVYWLMNPDQNPGTGILSKSGNSYDCWSGPNTTDMAVSDDGRTHNYGIKINNTDAFSYPVVDSYLTPLLLETTFTKNVT